MIKPRVISTPEIRNRSSINFLPGRLLQRMRGLPELCFFQSGHVVRDVMTARSKTRHLVVPDLLHDFRIGIVGRALLKTARPFVAVQTLAIVVRIVKM